jgi:hypothetical protein
MRHTMVSKMTISSRTYMTDLQLICALIPAIQLARPSPICPPHTHRWYCTLVFSSSPLVHCWLCDSCCSASKCCLHHHHTIITRKDSPSWLSDIAFSGGQGALPLSHNLPWCAKYVGCYSFGMPPCSSLLRSRCIRGCFTKGTWLLELLFCGGLGVLLD